MNKKCEKCDFDLSEMEDYAEMGLCPMHCQEEYLRLNLSPDEEKGTLFEQLYRIRGGKKEIIYR